MSKTTGLGDNYYVGGYNISGDVNSLQSISGTVVALDMTDITQSAMAREGGKRDGQMTWRSYLNTAASRAHDALSPLPTSAVIASYFRGTTIGNAAASMNARQVNYDPKRGDDGSLLIDVQALADSYGLDWGEQLTAGIRSDTAATNGASLDGSASSAFGLQAYLHVTEFTGTSVVVKLQDSPDDAAWSDVTGGSFGAISATGAARLATAADLSVARYLRVITGIGTFTSISFAVNVVRNDTAVVF